MQKPYSYPISPILMGTLQWSGKANPTPWLGPPPAVESASATSPCALSGGSTWVLGGRAEPSTTRHPTQEADPQRRGKGLGSRAGDGCGKFLPFPPKFTAEPDFLLYLWLWGASRDVPHTWGTVCCSGVSVYSAPTSAHSVLISSFISLLPAPLHSHSALTGSFMILVWGPG